MKQVQVYLDSVVTETTRTVISAFLTLVHNHTSTQTHYRDKDLIFHLFKHNTHILILILSTATHYKYFKRMKNCNSRYFLNYCPDDGLLRPKHVGNLC
jgi:hypothetical protein